MCDLKLNSRRLKLEILKKGLLHDVHGLMLELNLAGNSALQILSRSQGSVISVLMYEVTMAACKACS